MHVKKSVCSLALLSALLLGSCAGAAKDQPADASANQSSTEIQLSFGIADKVVGTATWTDPVLSSLES